MAGLKQSLQFIGDRVTSEISGIFKFSFEMIFKKMTSQHREYS